jgi:hypothetical protein
VEGSKLCLFSVIMPAKCVSSVSPRFHYRRVTFCFLPLAAIFESLFNLLAHGWFGGVEKGNQQHHSNNGIVHLCWCETQAYALELGGVEGMK